MPDYIDAVQKVGAQRLLQLFGIEVIVMIGIEPARSSQHAPP